MTTYDVARLGLVEIDGAAVLGGEMIPPVLVGIIVATYTIVVGAVVTGWSDFKDGIYQGYKAGIS